MAGACAHARLAAMAALPCARLASGGGGNACSRAPKRRWRPCLAFLRTPGRWRRRHCLLARARRLAAAASSASAPSRQVAVPKRPRNSKKKQWDGGGAPSGWGCEVAPAHLRGGEARESRVRVPARRGGDCSRACGLWRCRPTILVSSSRLSRQWLC